jgi:hypothetical protein
MAPASRSAQRGPHDPVPPVVARPARQAAHRRRAACRTRSRPSAVRGPVLMPPGTLQRPFAGPRAPGCHTTGARNTTLSPRFASAPSPPRLGSRGSGELHLNAVDTDGHGAPEPRDRARRQPSTPHVARTLPRRCSGITFQLASNHEICLAPAPPTSILALRQDRSLGGSQPPEPEGRRGRRWASF